MRHFHTVVLLALAVLLAASNATAQETRTLPLAGGGELTYLLMLPPGFDPDATYPVLVGMPPGAQNIDMARWGLRSYWGTDASARGWVVVSPVAPRGGWSNSSGAASVGPTTAVSSAS